MPSPVEVVRQEWEEGHRRLEASAGDRVLYARLPNGIAGSRLPDWERLLGLIVTVRNWNTVTRLRDLVTEAAAG